jgi:hypothetical protein
MTRTAVAYLHSIATGDIPTGDIPIGDVAAGNFESCGPALDLSALRR